MQQCVVKKSCILTVCRAHKQNKTSCLFKKLQIIAFHNFILQSTKPIWFMVNLLSFYSQITKDVGSFPVAEAEKRLPSIEKWASRFLFSSSVLGLWFFIISCQQHLCVITFFCGVREYSRTSVAPRLQRHCIRWKKGSKGQWHDILATFRWDRFMNICRPASPARLAPQWSSRLSEWGGGWGVCVTSSPWDKAALGGRGRRRPTHTVLRHL